MKPFVSVIALKPAQPSEISSSIGSETHVPDRTPEETASSLPHRHVDLFNQVGVSIITLLVYAMTMCRTIYTGDDGDFLTAMATNGNCHPTGYPLFLILGKAALSLFAPFFPDPASRVNFLTVLCGSAAVGFFYRFLASLKIERYLAWTGALILAFSPTLWQQSLSVEVYALTAAFLCALLWLTADWWQTPDNRARLQRLAFVYGLACTNHLTLVLFLPVFLGIVLYRRPALFGKEWPVLLSLGGLFVLPLSLYAYLPWSAAQNPPVNWGDPSTLQTFYEKISGAQYRMAMFRSSEVFLTHATQFFQFWKNGKYEPGQLLQEFGLYLLWLVPLGIIGFWKRIPRPFFILLATICAINLLFSFNYNIFDIYVYYIPAYVVTTTFIVTGLSVLFAAIFQRFHLSTEQRAHYQSLLAVICVALPLVHMSTNYLAADHSGNRLETDITENIFLSAPKNAIVVTSGSQTFSLWYRKYVLNERPDLVLINFSLMRAPYEQNSWYYRHIQRQYPDIDNTYPDRKGTVDEAFNNTLLFTLMQRAVDRGVPVIWVSNPQMEALIGDIQTRLTVQERLSQYFDRRPYGIVERLYKKGEAPTDQELFQQNRKIWPTLHFERLIAWAHADSYQEQIPLRYAEAFKEWGRLCETAGQKDLAIAAYRNAQALYIVPEATEGLRRLAAPTEPVSEIIPVPSETVPSSRKIPPEGEEPARQ